MSTFLEETGLEDYDPAGLDDRMESGGLLPEGRYAAILHGAKSVTSKQKGTPGHELTFKVTAGPFTGGELTDTLWVNKENAKSRDRLALFGSRLGLLVRNAAGRLTLAEGKQDFIDCLDQPVVIDVVHEEYDRDDGRKGKSARLSYAGVHNPNDPKVKESLKSPALPKGGSGTSKPAGTQATSKPTAPAATSPPPAAPARPRAGAQVDLTGL